MLLPHALPGFVHEGMDFLAMILKVPSGVGYFGWPMAQRKVLRSGASLYR